VHRCGGAETAETYRYATIKTDKDDYAPGELAVITGSGWQSGEAVTLIFQEDPAVHEDYTFAVVADPGGNIYSDQWAPEEHDLSVRFYLTAQGSVSRAQTTFTDGNVNVKTVGTTGGAAATVNWARFAGITCSGTSIASGTIAAGTNGNGTGVPGGATDTQSLLLTAQTLSGHTFANWEGDISTPAPDLSNPVCVAGRIPTRQIQVRYTADSTDPVVATISATSASPTNAASVSWTVTFSESVTGVDAADFSLPQSGLTNVPASPSVSGSGSSYTVTVDTGRGTGTLGLNLNDNDSIRNAAGNRLGGTGTGVAGGAGTGNGSLAGQAYSLDRTLAPAITVDDKPYDGTTAATILTRTLTSTLSLDGHGVSLTGGVATFADADAGVGKSVTATGLSLTGVDAARFVLSSTTATTTADITPVAATVSVEGYSGAYDGAQHGASGTATGVGGVDLSAGLDLGPQFTDVPGGTITWSFSHPNYVPESGTVNIDISPATAAIDVGSYSIEYDGEAHGLSGTATGVSGADLNSFLTFGAAVTDVPGGPITWAFDAGANYVTANGSATVTITPATATIAVADYSVEYNSQPHGLSGSATGVGGADLAGFLTFGTPVTDVPGGSIAWTFNAGANYVTANGSATVTITPATATINVAGYNGVYDTAAHGASLVAATGVGGVNLANSVTIGSQTFTDVPGGTVPWSFTNTNYVSQSGTVDVVISPATANINVPAYSVEYDSQPHALSGTATGVGGVNLASSLTFGAPVTDVPGGSIDWSFDAGANYATATGSTTVTITARPLTVTATGVNRSYNGTTNASVTLTDDRLAGDVFTVSYGSASFATKHVGNGKPIAVNGIAISGPDAGNYAANTTATASAEISAAGLTIAAVTDSRVYDGTVASAGVPTVGALFSGDTVTGVAQTFDNRHVGTGKTLSVTSYTVNDGNNGHNYMVALLADHLGVITQRALSVSGVTANNKPFDGNTSATLNLGAAALVGVIAPDAVTLNTAGATGTFASSAVGTWTVAVSGLTLGGTNAGNYSLTQPATTASITAWTLSGFFQPVGISNTYPGVPAVQPGLLWNTIKGGQTVPLKFELFATAGGAELTSLGDVSGFSLTLLSCSTGVEDPVEPEFVTPGATVLRYTDGQFIQNWDSPKGGGRCYRVTMTARDGSQLSAFFKTK
ncbi:MAG TPA: YDG domain-containing protein, partial [Vicinamibacterales bacterium]|nr:YDG domain-containing protein [Vicinamibacterales bacterium]